MASTPPPAAASDALPRGHNAIDIRATRLEALFETLDPSPFRDKALDRDFETYLLDCAGEFADDRPLLLVLHAPPALHAQVDVLASAVHAHFAFLATQHARRRRRLARHHRAVVVAGFGILAAALVLRRLLQGWSGGGEILTEGLLVLGWVAMWRPLEALLFDRRAARALQGVLHRLAEAKVIWRAGEYDASGG